MPTKNFWLLDSQLASKALTEAPRHPLEGIGSFPSFHLAHQLQPLVPYQALTVSAKRKQYMQTLAAP
jgi:hypothetical protein